MLTQPLSPKSSEPGGPWPLGIGCFEPLQYRDPDGNCHCFPYFIPMGVCSPCCLIGRIQSALDDEEEPCGDGNVEEEVWCGVVFGQRDGADVDQEAIIERICNDAVIEIGGGVGCDEDERQGGRGGEKEGNDDGCGHCR